MLAKTSPRQLERRFIKIFGINISDYILRTRILAAIEHLEHTHRTVSDIAQVSSRQGVAITARRSLALQGNPE